MLKMLRFFSYIFMCYIIAGVWVIFIKYYIGLFGILTTWVPILILGGLSWKLFNKLGGRFA